MREASGERRVAAGVGCVVFLSLLGTGFGGGVSLAQTKAAADAPPPNEVNLSGSLGERATSNPRLISDDASPEGDYVSDLRLELSVVRRSERTDWSLGYQPFYTRYRENTDLDTTNHSFNFQGQYDVSRRIDLTLGEHGNYSRNPLYVAQYETGNAPVVTRETKRWMSQSSIRMGADLSRSLTWQVGGSVGISRFQDPTFYDNQSYTVSTGLVKTLTRTQSVTSDYSFSHFLLTAPNLENVTTTAHGLHVGWAYAVTDQSGIRVSLGASRVSQGESRQTPITGDASFHHAFRRLSVSAGYRQSLAADLGVSQVNVSRDLYTGLAGRLGRLANWGLVGNYGERTGAVNDGGSGEKITYFGAALRGGLILGERLSLSGELSRREQNNGGGFGGSGQIPGGDITVSWFHVGLVFRIF